jgi:hypothetical protein
MSFVRSFASTAAIVAALTLYGCATTGANLSHSAERLERSTAELRSYAQRDSDSSSYTRDAQTLAEESRDFRHVVDDRRSSDADVRDAFDDVSKSYHSMRDEVERTHDRDAERDFQPVTEAYLDVEREMRDYHHHEDRYSAR